MEKRNQRSKAMALSGVLLALSIVTLFLASIIPGAELTLYAFSSFFVAVLIIEFAVKNAWVFYIASCLLSVVLIPNKVALLPYGLFFGIYGIIKYYIEKLGKQPIEIVLKLIFFNLSWGIGIYFFSELLLGNINIPDFPLAILIIGAQIMFLIYDYIFTMVIAFYQKRFSKV